MPVTMKQGQRVLLTASARDVNGNVVPAGSLSWETDNSSVVSLAPAEDTFSCEVTAVAVGLAGVTVADHAASLVSEVEEVTVVGGAPSELTITAGQAEDSTPAA